MRLKKVLKDIEMLNIEIEEYFDVYKNTSDKFKVDYYKYASTISEILSTVDLGDFFYSEKKKVFSFAKVVMDREWGSSEVEKFNFIIMELNGKINTLKVNLEKTQIKSDIENIYAIKLPKYENFCDVVDFSKELNLIFKFVLDDENKAKLVGFDVGSEWFLIGFELYEDFKLFAEFMLCVYAILKNTKDSEDTLKQIPDETHAEVKQYMKSIKDILVKNNIKKLEALKERELTTQEIIELETSLMKMEKLVQQGTEVHIDAQPSSKEEMAQGEKTFIELPNSNQIKGLIETPNPLLLEKNENENEN